VPVAEAAPRWRVDLHVHSCYSPDSLSDPAALIARARAAGLDRVAITDHNQIAGALAARQLAPDLVIVGEEITLDGGGELIAYFVKERVPAGLSAAEAIAELRRQGAAISVSHPVDRFRDSALGEKMVRAIAGDLDALEVRNARCLSMTDNFRAESLARELNLAPTAGSDAHWVRELGAASIIVPPFADSEEAFLSSLRQGEVEGRASGIFVRLATTYAKWHKKRVAGMITAG